MEAINLTNDGITITLNEEEIFRIHNVLDSLMIGDIKEVLLRYDYPDGMNKFFEEHENTVDDLYRILDNTI